MELFAGSDAIPSLPNIDLVGHPFAVIESDPGVFTTLTRKLGVRGLEVVELYDIEPWAVDHLAPRGLIFCFLWCKDDHRPDDFADPAAEKVWFANQLIDDACASQAILNVVLNCPDVDIGDALRQFCVETSAMSPVMKGLAISNCSLVQQAHNSLARPADIRGALHAAAKTTALANVSSSSSRRPKFNPEGKKPDVKQKQKMKDERDRVETYHFIGYVPAHGKVWELDGLKSGPLEVGEIPLSENSASAWASSSTHSPRRSTEGWMSAVRPALRMKMQKYGGDNIKFSLLALVDDQYEVASDRLELCRRDKDALERRLEQVFGEDGWRDQVSAEALTASAHVFSSSTHKDHRQVFAPDFALRSMESAMRILNLPAHNLSEAWVACIGEARIARDVVEEELAKGRQAQVEHIKRTHDYEPFIQQFVTCLHNEGLLRALLPGNPTGKSGSKPKKARANAKS